MKSSRKWLAFGVLAVSAAFVVRAALPSWADDTVAGTALEAALFRIMAVPGGVVMHLRPPWESRSHIGKLIQQTPHDAELYSIRAREEERGQDYVAAEADWKQSADNSQDKLAGLTELADFYRRRVEPDQEVNTLLRVGAIPQQPSQQFQSNPQQTQWTAFIRATAASKDHLLPTPRHEEIYNAWIRRYPKDTAPYQAYLDWAVRQHNRRAAAAIAARMKAAFPHDVQLAVSTDANLAGVESGANAAMAVYSKNFSALWPDALRTEYFQALTSAHELRTFLGNAQAAAAAHPTDLDPVLRISFYYEQEGRKDIAGQELLTYVSRRSAQGAAWTPAELKTIAALWLRLADYDESARLYYTLYQLPSAPAGDRELALSSIVGILLDVPEQPLHFANRDLSLYKNIAEMDRHPGFLNGILSLALNTTFPDYHYQNASQVAVAYFHRASASRLIDKLQQEFPNSSHAPELQAKLYSAYAVYGQEDAMIRSVPAWLDRNPNSTAYVDTALLLADAYQSKVNTSDELALYDRLLTELADKSSHMPIGESSLLPNSPQANNARSPDYSRVLDRYISRLVQLGRAMDAVALFRREIDRNPDDPGIYERLALFLEQNRLDNDVALTYRQAFSHFKDMSWASKLARFYVRKKQYSAYQQLTRQITETFKGSELAAFLTNVPPDSPTLYRQVNLYAHRRFPHNLVFVTNLLRAYRTKPTIDMAAYEKLLRENWFNDANLRTSFFEYLSSTGKLHEELNAAPAIDRAVADSNVAALEFRAEGHAWLTDYETAAQAFVRLASIAPGDRNTNGQAISIERSLGATNSGAFDTAIRLAEQDVKAAPADSEGIIRVGEIYSDREMYSQARPWWNRAAAIQPGLADGYLGSATVFWDYFQFNDALRMIQEARQKLGQPARFGYEAGAIYENEGKYREAIASYIQAALHDSSEQAKNRLIVLAQRKATGALVEQETATLTLGIFDVAGFELRLAILEKENRRGAIQTALADLLPRANNTSEIDEIRGVANRLGFDDIAAQSFERTVAITTDPIEKIQARIDLARFYETHNQAANADHEFSSLLKDDPNRLGVVRAAVDFYWREKQARKAVGTLEAAVSRAQQPYQNSLTREAAEKATDSGLYEDARRLLDRLLANDPYNGDLLSEKASTYARQNDNPGLIAFYAAELKSVQSAPLPAQDKATRIAALRRGYILALTAVEQFTDALEQYQLVLNAFPEDASLATEVSRFAEAHQLGARLTAYYLKATTDSPHDYRWPLVLARVQTSLRHYPEAIAAYDKAGYIRPDRSDIFLAKADLETRLLRFSDALESYRKIYELSYHDVEYLADQAAIYARMGNKAEALRLVRAAYIEPQPREPAGYVTAMRQLATWGMFDAADSLFRELRPLLSPNEAWKQQALTLEVEALVSLHRPADAISLVAAMVEKPEETVPIANTIGTSVRQYLTPQEKSLLAQQFEKTGALPPQFDRYQFAKAAGFHDIEARALAEASQSAGESDPRWQTLNQLQSSRLLFGALGHELEAIAKTRTGAPEYEQILNAAFAAYANAGDTASQLRLVDYAGSEFPRLFTGAAWDLDSRLTALASANPKRADAVVQYLFANASATTLVQAIAVRGNNLSPLWINSYTALAGLYLLSPEPWATQSFDAVLGPRTVGGELAAGSSNSALRNANWFYYAARYGDYLGYGKLPGAEDYLPASLEANPVASDSYVQLADTCKDLKQTTRAAALYDYALQLSPDRADVYDRLALLAMEGNRRAEALAEWRHAFQLLAARVEKGPLPPDYWTTARQLLTHMNQLRAVAELKPDADTMLRVYARRNGSYQFQPFLEGIFDHPPDRPAALQWVLELSQLSGMDNLVTQVLISQNWVEAGDKDPLYRAEIERARQAATSAAGEQAVEAREELKQRIIEYARYLETQRRWADEWVVLEQMQPAPDRPQELVLTAGALTGHLDNLLKEYRAKPEAAPPAEQTLGVASTLEKLGHRDLALQVKNYEYQHELQGNSPPASAWFGLARVRFEQKRNDDALALIRDVTLSVGAPFENLPEAVHVLGDVGLKDQAARYALEWKTAEPWNEEAQLAFARLKADATLLDAVRRSPNALYSIRVRAAESMRDLGNSVDGTDELSLLTHKSISAEQAAQPFYVSARLQAARESPVATEKIRLYGEAIAFDPDLPEPRLDLAEAALRNKQDAFGLAAFDSDPSPSGNPDNFTLVEQLAADAFARQQSFARALHLYDDLLKQINEPVKRNEIQQARESVSKQRHLRLLNLARRPIVTEQVSQRVIVKPKLKSLPARSVLVSEAGTGEEEQ